MTTNGSAAVALEAATAERILHKLRDKGRKEGGREREERAAPEMERRDRGGGRLRPSRAAWDLLAGREKVKSHFEEANSVRFDEG